MPDDKYINVETDVTTNTTSIVIFSEYVPGDYWILRTGYWDNEGIWNNNAVWQVP